MNVVKILNFEEYETQGVFYFNGEHFIELVPLSYELQDYFKQNEFFYLKLDAEENKMERIIFHTNKHDDGINNKDINDKGIIIKILMMMINTILKHFIHFLKNARTLKIYIGL